MHDAGKVASFISVDYLQGICRIDGRQAEAISQIRQGMGDGAQPSEAIRGPQNHIIRGELTEYHGLSDPGADAKTFSWAQNT